MVRPIAVIAFLIGLAPAFAFWWQAGRPVVVVDGAGGKIPCVSYTPFRGTLSPHQDGIVIPKAWIEADMKLLASHVGCVRTYAVDQGLDAVPEAAAKAGLKVLLGIWIGRKEADNRAQIETAIALARKYKDTVRAVIVGNEVLLRREQSPESMARYLAEVRRRTGVPVTYADVWEFWLQNAGLAAAVDFVTVHILPYWEDYPIPADASPGYIVDIWKHVKAKFPGKDVFIGEVGWPSAGRMREGSRPGRVEQAQVLRGFSVQAAATPGLDYNLIEAFDQPWKRAQEGTVGGYWGVFAEDRVRKFPWRGPVAEDPNWRFRFAVAAGLALVLMAGLSIKAGGAPGRWFAVGLGAHLFGSAAVLQWGAAVESARTALEWTVATAGIALTAGVAWAVLRRTIEGAGGRPATVDRALAWVVGRAKEPLGTAMSLGLLRATAFVAATVVTLALAFDGRYRGFPVAAFIVPAVLFAVLAWFNRRDPIDGHAPEESWLAGVLAVGAIVVAAVEGWRNHQALLWTATALALAAPALIDAWRRRRR